LEFGGRSLLVVLGWGLVQGQIGFLILIRTRGSLFILAIFIISILASLLLDGFEQAFRCWLLSILLTGGIIFLLLPLPSLIGVLPIEVASIIVIANISRMIVSILIIIIPIGFLGCFIGQMLRNVVL